MAKQTKKTVSLGKAIEAGLKAAVTAEKRKVGRPKGSGKKVAAERDPNDIPESLDRRKPGMTADEMAELARENVRKAVKTPAKKPALKTPEGEKKDDDAVTLAEYAKRAREKQARNGRAGGRVLGAAKNAGKKVREGSKVTLIASLLKRKEGTTTAEVLKATGWPAVSMPQQAKAAKLTLRKEKVQGQPTRYYAS
jgi:cell pole-organizing protein PopZ